MFSSNHYWAYNILFEHLSNSSCFLRNKFSNYIGPLQTHIMPITFSSSIIDRECEMTRDMENCPDKKPIHPLNIRNLKDDSWKLHNILFETFQTFLVLFDPLTIWNSLCVLFKHPSYLHANSQ